MTLTRINLPALGLATGILAAIALAAANFTGDGNNGGAGPYAFTLGLSLLVAVALFGWVIPRIDKPARAGVVVGALAVLSISAFWLGLPYVLGPAAVVLGLLGRARADSRGASTTAIVLGAVATIGAVAALVLDQMS